jgi:N-acetylglucosamine-6-sulfatase
LEGVVLQRVLQTLRLVRRMIGLRGGARGFVGLSLRSRALKRRNERRVFLGILGCLAVLFAVGCSGSGAAQREEARVQTKKSSTQPSIVFILTDDLDYASAQQLPTVRSQLIEKGTSFNNAFISDSLCCPSRATILTGLYAHDHGVETNNPPKGGFPKFDSEGREEDTIATRLQQGGYETALFGKYLNHYPGDETTTHVPPGWDEWHVWGDTLGNEDNSTNEGEAESGAEYYGYKLNENGEIVSYGDSSEDYITDVLSRGATDFIRSAASGSKPFFLYLAPTAPHGPPVPAERHRDAFADEKAPRPPSFDEEDVLDKPPWIRETNRFSDQDVYDVDTLYRERLGSMLSVDEMVDSIVQELEADGQLDNTFIFFASDNGFLLGQHRIQNDKRYPYEESIRTPLFFRGPGVPTGSTLEKLVVNTDFAPTLADLAGTSLPPTDGRSLTPLLRGEDPSWRSAILLEGFQKPNKKRSLPPYRAIRTETHKYVEYDTGDKELYDLEADPYELDNVYESAGPSLVSDLKTRLDVLRSCTSEGCREAEDDP